MIRVGIGGWTYEPWRGIFYPKGLKHADELKYASGSAHLDRDQRHLLSDPVGGELRQVARRDAGRFRLRGEGPPCRRQQKGAGRVRRGARLVLEVGRHGAGREARSAALAVRALQEIRSRRFRRLPGAAAEDGRRADAPPRGRGALRHLPGAGVRGACPQAQCRGGLADSDDYPAIADVTADFIYARLQKTEEGIATGYAPADLDRWAERARIWAAGGEADDLPRFAARPARRRRSARSSST